MRTLLSLALISLCFSLTAQETINYPYNPDGNADGNITVPDLADFLVNYGNTFTPTEIQIDGVGLAEVIGQLQATVEAQQAYITQLQQYISISEETVLKPKPLVEIGGKPILWHIMKIYSSYGINDFIILLGYKGYFIKEYFANYFLHQSDVTINLEDNSIEVINNSSEPWKVTLLDTGLNTMTGGRIKRAQNYIGDKTFMLTYGDGVADINIKKLIKFQSSVEIITFMLNY